MKTSHTKSELETLVRESNLFDSDLHSLVFSYYRLKETNFIILFTVRVNGCGNEVHWYVSSAKEVISPIQFETVFSSVNEVIKKFFAFNLDLFNRLDAE